MALYQGSIAGSASGNLQTPYITSDINSLDALQWPPFYQARAASSPGSVAPFRTIAPAYGRLLAGVLATSYFNDYYNRIHIRPTALNLGNVLTVQTRTVEVWNSYVTPANLTSINVTAGQGVTVSPSSPGTFQPNQAITYTVQAGLSGPPSISANITYNFDVGTYVLPVTGNRIVVFPFRPEWSQKVRETLEYMTAISSSRNKTEQRMALRATPRRMFEFTVQLQDTDAAQFEQLVFGWDGHYYALPLWTETTFTSASILAGATTVTADISDRTFVAGGLAVLYSSPRHFEAVQIASIAGNTLTLSQGTANTWPANTRLVPANLATLAADFGANRLTDGVVQARVSFMCDPQTTDPRTSGGSAAATYNGDELYASYTDWSRGVAQQITSDYQTVDSGSGIFKPYQKSGWPDIVKPHSWQMRSRPSITAMRQWVGRRTGRWKPVWMPTGTNDFTLLSTVTGTSTALTVANQGYAVYGGQVERNRILIQLYNGTAYARQITSASVVDENTQQLVIDSALGVTVTPSQVKRISFLELYRLASDQVTFTWETSSIATLDLNLQLTKPSA